MDMGSSSRVMPPNYQIPTSSSLYLNSRGALSSFGRRIYALRVDITEDFNSGLWGAHLPTCDATSAKVMKFDDMSSSTNIYAMIYYVHDSSSGIAAVPSFSEHAQCYLQGVIDGFCIVEAIEMRVIRCERKTNHDHVKAVERFLKLRCISIRILEIYN
ncbi:hypothetical protein ACLB2K_046538 [Fragaria x ananassa]